MSRGPYGDEGIKIDLSDDSVRATIEAQYENKDAGAISILRHRRLQAFHDGKPSLPAEKGYPIQIGSELFRLSGASIMSDGLSIGPSTLIQVC